MKKNFKRTLAAVMAAALTVTMIGMPSETDAAKKIKLSKSTVTVTKGKTKKVTIKNVKKNQVKKLKITANKKAKKIATVKKSGKTALKVKGKKAGSAKFTVNVTVKGKKKATKLKLTVKVKKATPSTGGGATTQTQAPGGTTQTQAPGGTNPGGTAPTLDPGTPQTQAPGDPTREPRPTNSAKPSKEPTTPPRQWGEVTPVPQAQKVKSMILKYTDEVQTEEKTEGCGKLSEMGKIAFRDAKEGYTIGKDEKFDILNYDRIVIKLNAKDRAKMGEGDNGEPYSGKIGLSSTDSEVFGAHVDGFITQYESDGQTRGKLIFLNDIDGMTEEKGGTSPIAEKTYKTEAYPDGYVIEYKIPGDISKTNWWTPDDISNYCDCINFQLADKDTYDDFYVEEIQLLTDKTATAENLEIKAGKDTIKVDESTDLTVSMKDVPDYAEISKVEWSADENVALSDQTVADNKKTAAAKVTGKKEAAKAAVTAKVTVSIDGKDFEVEVSKEIKVDKKDGQGGEDDKTEVKATDLELKADADEVEVDATTKLTLALKNTAPKGAAIKSADWSVSPADGAGLTGDAATERTFTARKAGKVTVTAKVTAEAGGKEFGDLTVTKEITVKAKQQGGDEVKVTAADLEIVAVPNEIEVGQTSKVTASLKNSAPEGAEIKTVNWSVDSEELGTLTEKKVADDKKSAEVTFTGLKAQNELKVRANVTVTAGGKDFEISEISAMITVKAKVEKTEIEETDLTLELGVLKAIIKRTETANATVSLNEDVADTMKITSVAWSAVNSAVAECTNPEPNEGGRSCSTSISGLVRGKTAIKAVVTVQDGDKAPATVEVVSKEELSVVDVTAEDLTISITKGQIRINETAKVEVGVKNQAESGAEITGIVWAVSDTACVETTDVSTATTQEFKGKDETENPVTITATVAVRAGGKDFTIPMTVELSVVSLPVEAHVETSGIEVIAGDTTTFTVVVETADYESPEISIKWTIETPDVEEGYVDAEIVGADDGETVSVKCANEGKVGVIAWVMVKDGEKQNKKPVKVRASINVLHKLVASDIKVEIEADKTVAAQNETFSLEIANNSDAGIEIDHVLWGIAPNESATVEVSAEDNGKTAEVSLQRQGDVEITARVWAKMGSQKDVYVVRTITLKADGVSYAIGKKVTFADDTKSDVISVIDLDSPITVKKTDKVNVVFSVRSSDGAEDTTTKFEVVLSPWTVASVENHTTNKVRELGVLRTKIDENNNSVGSAAGTVPLTIDTTYFNSNRKEINGIALSPIKDLAQSREVTVEKILVIPTDDLAITLTPSTDKFGTKVNESISVEIDDCDFTDIRWELDSESTGTVKITPDATKKTATIVGDKVGDVKINVIVVRGDKEETFSVSGSVVVAYKKIPNEVDFSNALLSSTDPVNGKHPKVDENGFAKLEGTDSEGSIVIPLPGLPEMKDEEGNTLDPELKAGEKVSVDIEVVLHNGSEGFRLYTSNDASTQGSNIDQQGVNSVTEDTTVKLKGVELTTTIDCKYLLIRSAAWNKPLTNMTIKSVTITYI